MAGKMIWRGMNYGDAIRAIIDSDRYDVIAEGDGWFWVRTLYGDVIEVLGSNGVVVSVDFL